MNLISVVIVKCQEGYKAHIRFEDSSLDADISSTNKGLLYSLIDSHLYRRAGIRTR